MQDRFAATCEAIGQRVPLSGLRISPPLADWEAKYFLLGLGEDLFAVDDHGRVASDLLVAAEDAQPYRLFSLELEPLSSLPPRSVLELG